MGRECCTIMMDSCCSVLRLRLWRPKFPSLCGVPGVCLFSCLCLCSDAVSVFDALLPLVSFSTLLVECIPRTTSPSMCAVLENVAEDEAA